MRELIGIIDYGMGNLNSVKRKINILGAEAIITNDISILKKTTKLVLPGVGNFKKAMDNLNSLGIIPILNQRANIDKIPILGICLGMQLMCNFSEEGNVDGLSWINGRVVRFKKEKGNNEKIPHMGWNTLEIEGESPLMKDITEENEMYFVHSYHVELQDEKIAINKTNYAYPFVSGFQKENLFGLQYHPEKSHDAGGIIFKNFLKL